MPIYLPIAEMSVNVFLLLGIGGVVGFLSGMFGVGGGFLMTPLLFFLGIPPAVAVATGANQIIAASVSGALAHWQKRTIDFRMGLVLLVGGLIGSGIGAWIFTALSRLGQIDLVINLAYVLFLGVIGALMLTESIRSILRRWRAPGLPPKRRQHIWLHGLPLRIRFPRSKLYISALLPLLIGFVVGIMVAIMGVGGGFLMVPAMIYILGMPTSVVVGTSLFQIIFVTASVTLLHSVNTQTVDVMLALLLLAGAVVGAQFGTRIGAKLRGEQLRALLALLVLLVCVKLAWGLIAEPADLFTLATTGGGGA